MTIIDALADNGAMRVTYGSRWLTATSDAEGEYFEVREQRPRQKYPRLLVETSNEDEAVRFLLGEKG